jgi:hypothetical protein
MFFLELNLNKDEKRIRKKVIIFIFENIKIYKLKKQYF